MEDCVVDAANSGIKSVRLCSEQMDHDRAAKKSRLEPERLCEDDKGGNQNGNNVAEGEVSGLSDNDIMHTVNGDQKLPSAVSYAVEFASSIKYSIDGEDSASMRVQKFSEESYNEDIRKSNCIQAASCGHSPVDLGHSNRDLSSTHKRETERHSEEIFCSAENSVCTHPLATASSTGNALKDSEVSPFLKDNAEGDRLICTDNRRVHSQVSLNPIAEKSIDGHHFTYASTRSPSKGATSKQVSVGPRQFMSAVEMLSFFNQLLSNWPLNHDINRYEHLMLEDLLKKGHPDFQAKIGKGIKSFQVRVNKNFDSRCFYIIRSDGSMEDFSYRKCVNKILPLPKNLKPKSAKRGTQKSPHR